METVYDEDFDLDNYTVQDVFHMCVELLSNDLPVPMDLIAKLENAGIYIRN
jgi:hypothetical protein